MSELVKELAALIGQLRFTNERADLRSGKHWTVYVHPWPTEREDFFDALISIIPNSPEADPSQGFILQVECDGNAWQSERKTNQQGQTFFKRLPLGYFTARMGKAVPAMRKERLAAAEKERLAAAEDVRLAAKDEPSKDSGPSVKSAEEISSSLRIQYHLPDRRITALLELGETGQAVFTFETEAPELKGAVIRLSVGEDTGEVKLMPSRRPGAWSARCGLEQDFQLARREVPTFELILPSES